MLYVAGCPFPCKLPIRVRLLLAFIMALSTQTTEFREDPPTAGQPSAMQTTRRTDQHTLSALALAVFTTETPASHFTAGDCMQKDLSEILVFSCKAGIEHVQAIGQRFSEQQPL